MFHWLVFAYLYLVGSSSTHYAYAPQALVDFARAWRPLADSLSAYHANPRSAWCSVLSSASGGAPRSGSYAGSSSEATSSPATPSVATHATGHAVRRDALLRPCADPMARRTASRDAVGHRLHPVACRTKGTAPFSPERGGHDGRLRRWTATLPRP